MKRKLTKEQKRIRGRKQRLNRILSRACIVIVIAVVVINLLTPSREVSDQENRSLAQRPKLTAASLRDGSFFSDFSDYYADQFFLRDGWITLNLFGERVLGRSENGGVFFGKDGYLLPTPETPDTEALQQTEEAINQFSAKHADGDLAEYIMIVPDSAAILSDKLPAQAPVRDQIDDIALIGDHIDKSVKWIDAASVLQKHTSDYIYYKTDHHWTSLGAGYVFQDTCGDMGLDNRTAAYDLYQVSDNFRGTLSSESGSRFSKDDINIYVPNSSTIEYYVNYPDEGKKSSSIFDSSALDTKDQYAVFEGGNHSVVEINTNNDNGKNLLIFKDSYANSYVQFLIPYYERIIMIDPRYYYDDIDSALQDYSITDILYLYSADTFVKDTSLKNVLGYMPSESGTSGSTGESVDGSNVTGTSSGSDVILGESILDDSSVSGSSASQ